jgi:uncharacterized membrane protein
VTSISTEPRSSVKPEIPSIPVSALMAFAVVGMAFSSFLTYVTFTTGQSACEFYYFGLPSCAYGLAIYILVFLASLPIVAKVRNKRTIALIGVSLVGIAFSGSLTAYILSLQSCVRLVVYGVPPCVMGLAMFIVVLAIGVSLWRSAQDKVVAI